MDKVKSFLQNNVDWKLVTSGVVTFLVVGGVVVVANRSGVKPLKTLVNAAK